ncbi:hypothetical protein M9H77_18059 [Catharanthus roseus]|uniref:Uncharacterized protein n=1 Tax=Catharanthus roseus TaxID=4058 RepID=A0ACC0B6C3_CATRO|nr:hypothetical protein M9H77_18059 [Catharanthus roseus]
MFHGLDAPGSTVLPPPFSTRVRMPYYSHTPSPPRASSSLAAHPDATDMHDIHQHYLPISPDVQYPPLVVDDFLVGATRDFSLYYRPSKDGPTETLGPLGPLGIIIQMINDDLGVRLSLSVSKGSDAHHRMLMSVISTISDSVRLSTKMRASCYLLSILSNSLFPNKSDLPVASYDLWPRVRNLRRNLGQAPRSDARELGGFLITNGAHVSRDSIYQYFVMMGQRSGTIALSDYRMRFDVMIAAEFGRTQGIPHVPIFGPVKHSRLASTKSYVVRHTFIRAFWYDATSQCVHADHMQHIVMPPHACIRFICRGIPPPSSDDT